MKNKLLLSVLLLSSVLGNAQHLTGKIFANSNAPFKTKRIFTNRQNVNKPTATEERIKAAANVGYDGASFYTHDSTYVVSYTGENGGAIKWQDYFSLMGSELTVKYDATNGYTYNTSTSSWEMSYRETRTFDANNNITTSIYESYDVSSSSWVNTSKYIYSYDANNNMITEISQNWNTSTNAWDNYSKDLYSYDANNNRIGDIYQNWNSGTSAWDNSGKNTYTYSASNMTTSDIYQYWNSGTSAWVNSGKTTYNYSSGGVLSDSYDQIWNSGTSVWDNNAKTIYTANASGDITEITEQDWNSATSLYENDSKTMITYDANHNGIETISQNWDNASSAYENDEKQLFTYNSNNNITSIGNQEWNPGGFWEYAVDDYQVTKVYYETYTVSDVSDIINKGGIAHIYPSPASSSLNIVLNWDEKQPFSVNIVDATGRSWMNWNQPAATEYKETLNIQSLANGNYWIVVRGQKGTLIQQVAVTH